VRVVSWGHGLGRWHADLTDVTNRDAQARQIAATVDAFRSEQPGDPVFLVAKSGGTGVVIRALEHLDPDAVDRVVLLAPAISPTYDLSRALRAVRGEMVVFWSPLDVFVLGAGTRIFGTMDRVRTISAGMVGFRTPIRDCEPVSASAIIESAEAGAGADRRSKPAPGLEPSRATLYGRLRQIRWRPVMAATGYFGGHVGPDSPAFLRKYVVPLLRPAARAPR
jgi:pimeloyl-ACP methyl ester carboxylesterase